MINDYWTNNSIYEKYSKQFGSKYAAVNYLASDARNRCDILNNRISHSDSLNWVITGKQPNHLFDEESYEEKIYSRSLDRLNYVLDQDVKDSVELTISESRKMKHLIYMYSKESLSEPVMSRIRVLSNLIWNKVRR